MLPAYGEAFHRSAGVHIKGMGLVVLLIPRYWYAMRLLFTINLYFAPSKCKTLTLPTGRKPRVLFYEKYEYNTVYPGQ